MRPSSPWKAQHGPGSQHAEASDTEIGAAVFPSSRAMRRAVTKAGSEAWQAREKFIARHVLVQIPYLRITRIAIGSFAQVRRLLGKRIVVRQLSKLGAVTVVFGDAQRFPQDRVQTPAMGRSRRMRRVRESNAFVPRFA